MLSPNKKAKARLARSRVARGQVTSTQASVWQKEPRRPRGQESESFALRTDIVGGVGVRYVLIGG